MFSYLTLLEVFWCLTIKYIFMLHLLNISYADCDSSKTVKPKQLQDSSATKTKVEQKIGPTKNYWFKIDSNNSISCSSLCVDWISRWRRGHCPCTLPAPSAAVFGSVCFIEFVSRWRSWKYVGLRTPVIEMRGAFIFMDLHMQGWGVLEALRRTSTLCHDTISIFIIL